MLCFIVHCDTIDVIPSMDRISFCHWERRRERQIARKLPVFASFHSLSAPQRLRASDDLVFPTFPSEEMAPTGFPISWKWVLSICLPVLSGFSLRNIRKIILMLAKDELCLPRRFFSSFTMFEMQNCKRLAFSKNLHEEKFAYISKWDEDWKNASVHFPGMMTRNKNEKKSRSHL